MRALYILWLLPTLLAAQHRPPTPLWSKTLGGTSTDELMAMAPTPDGGCLLAGSTLSGAGADKSERSRGGRDGWVVKLDAQGNQLWDRTLGGSGQDYARTLAVLPDGSCYVVLASLSPADGDRVAEPLGGLDIWLVKLSADGLVLWDRTIGSPGHELAHAALPTAQGGLLLAGYTSDSSATGHHSEPTHGHCDYWVVCLDADGQVLWDRTLGGTGHDEATAIVPTHDGYLIGGSMASPTEGGMAASPYQAHDYGIAKLDTLGHLLYQYTIGAGQNDQLIGLAMAPDSTLVLAGHSNSEQGLHKSDGTHGQEDYWVTKLSPMRQRLWERTLGSPGTDLLTAALALPQGHTLLGGYSVGEKGGEKSDSGQGSWDWWLLYLDDKGYLLWDKTWGGSAGDYLAAMAPTADGRILLAGYTESHNGDVPPHTATGTDWWVVCLPQP